MTPKFRVGDVVIDNKNLHNYTIIDIDDKEYTYVYHSGGKRYESKLEFVYFERNGTRKLTKLDKALK